ncbi:MAG: hypothetical protein SWK90_00925 [Chloroflexota bacterium]|nr:hypothetical protein [Chloroflexota bacterium]
MVKVHLYGDLRRYALDPRPDRESIVHLEPRLEETVGTMLERIGISSSEIHHIFLNGALLSTRNSMAPWLDYRQARGGAPNRDLGLDTPVRDNDRVGLFASDMGLLVV